MLWNLLFEPFFSLLYFLIEVWVELSLKFIEHPHATSYGYLLVVHFERGGLPILSWKGFQWNKLFRFRFRCRIFIAIFIRNASLKWVKIFIWRQFSDSFAITISNKTPSQSLFIALRWHIWKWKACSRSFVERDRYNEDNRDEN